MDNIDITAITDAQYNESVVFAVRYGYQYRIEAEHFAEDESNLHFYLPEASKILLWIGELVLSGVAFDVIKSLAVKLWNKLMQMKVNIPEDVNKVLLDEYELKRFVSYVDEFNEKRLNLSDKEIAYIREEIIVDYCVKRSNEIREKEKRALTLDDHITITREAIKYADNLIGSHGKG